MKGYRLVSIHDALVPTDELGSATLQAFLVLSWTHDHSEVLVMDLKGNRIWLDRKFYSIYNRIQSQLFQTIKFYLYDTQA
jgi:hypothetical protein